MSHRSDASDGDRHGGRRGPGGAVSASGRGRPAREEAHAEGEPRADGGRSPEERPAPTADPAASADVRERERYVDERGRNRERYVEEGDRHPPVAGRDTRDPGVDRGRGALTGPAAEPGRDREHAGRRSGSAPEIHDRGERGRGADSGGNTPAILAPVLGVASVLSLLVSLGGLFFLALPLGIAAIVLGFMGKRRADRRPTGRQGMAAKVGLGLGAVGTAVSLLAILLLLLGASLLGGAIGGLNREVDKQAQQEQQGDSQRQRDELARRAARQREELARRAARQREEIRRR